MKKRLGSSKIKTGFSRAAAFLMTVVLLATGVSFDVAATENPTDGENYYRTRVWKFDGSEDSDAIEGTYTDDTKRNDVIEFAGMTIDATQSGNCVSYNAGSSCTQFEPTVTVKIPAAGKYTLTMTNYCWTNATVQVDGGKVQHYSGDQNMTFKGIVGDSGYVTIVCAGDGIWMKEITMTCEELTDAGEIFEDYNENRKIDVWDFGGVEEADTDKYTNHISKSFWDGIEVSMFQDNSLGRFKAKGEYTFGDLVMKYRDSDRLYYNNADNTDKGTNSAGGVNSYNYDFKDGYVSRGAYYAAGTGSSNGQGDRCLVLNNVYAGDVITTYTHVNNAQMDLHVLYLGDEGEQDDTVTVKLETYTKGTFTAEYNGSYLLYMSGTGKPRYLRVVRTPGVLVSGTVNTGEFTLDDYSVVLQDKASGKTFNAYLPGDGTFKAFVPANAELSATMVGAMGYGFTDTSKVIVTGSTKVENAELVVEAKDLVTLSGDVTGFAGDYDLSNLKLTLVCTDESLLKDDVNIDVTNGAYSVQIEKDIEYKLEMSGVNDYDLAAEFVVESSVDVAKDIVVVAKPLHTVTGSFLGLAEGDSVTAIKFTNLADEYEYTGNVSATGYTANLRDGDYEISAKVDGYKMVGHVVVKGGNVTKDLLYVSTAAVAAKEFVADIYVGCPEQENNYETVRDAIKAIEAMRKTNATDRITVHIAPGTYREQIIIEAPNVSFVNTNPEEEVLLTWYYATGYYYYSSGTDKYYNETNAFDKYLKNPAEKWGAATYIKSKATGFYAENITFENSFTKYICEEELADGVEADGATITYDRTAPGADATTRAANERSCALAVEGDKAEFYNCKVLGGQDTLYTGTVRAYFNDCFLEGNTDYIFGSGEIIFDNCELQFYGYSDALSGAVLTAAADNQTYGYIFRNCFISANPDWEVAPAKLGRPWRTTAMVTYLNCKLQNTGVIEPVGWGDMSGNKATEANFKEFNMSCVTGETVDLSNRVTGVTTQNPYPTGEDIVNVALSGWTPATFAMDTNNVGLGKALNISGKAKVGAVLTADYALNGENAEVDSSVIQWYRVTEEGETLVKASVAYVDNTYTVSEADADAQIKVIVRPETVSGYTGTAITMTVDVTDGGDEEEPGGNENPGGNETPGGNEKPGDDEEPENEKPAVESKPAAGSAPAEVVVDWNAVQTEVKSGIAKAATQGSGVNLNYACTGENKVPVSVLSDIKGKEVTVAFQSGNGVALSISGQKLNGTDVAKLQNVDLTVTKEPNVIPDNVVASKAAVAKRELSIKDNGSFGVAVDMHINVGKENAGKVANLYRYNPTSGKLEFCSHFVITAEGQSMFAIGRGGDYMITVTNTEVSENTWYFGGEYTVQAGDNLSAIAVRYHMPLAELVRRNPQLTNLNMLRTGQKLNLQ